jgi:hypothetical protein
MRTRPLRDVGRDRTGDHVYLVDKHSAAHPGLGPSGVPFFGELILDCLQGTERAMTQQHAFAAAQLCLRAQQQAVRIEG